MNKKKIISAGVFIGFVAIGGGIAYYFYPTAINGALGINAAQVNGLADDSTPLPTDDATASAGDLASGAPVAAPSASSPAKANVSSKKSASPQSTAGATNNEAGPGVVSASASDTPTALTPASSSSPLPAAAPCAFPSAAPSAPTRQIIFNEIAWMGSPSSATAEWMELKNISLGTVDLAGWQLANASGKITISFSAGDGALAPGGLLLLARGSTTPTGAASVGKTYSGDLANTGDVLALIDPQCNISDYVAASGGWPAGNNTTKATMERDADGVGWHTSAMPGGTPGAENSAGVAMATTTPAQAPTSPTVSPSTQVPAPTTPTVTPQAPTPSSTQAPSSTSTTNTTSSDSDAATTANDTAVATSSQASPPPSSPPSSSGSAGHVLIAAVQIAGAAADNDLVKLYNPTGAAIDMSGWKLHKKSSTGADYSLKIFPSGSVIAAGGTFEWANSTDGFSDSVGANVASTETLAADNSVALMDAAGNVVDAVAWGTGTSQYGEGPPYPTSPGANQLLSRRSSGNGSMADTGDNSNDFTIQ